MDTMNNPNSDSVEHLQRYLLLPRRPVGFKEVDGSIESVDPQTKIRPVVVTSNPKPDLVGLRSGQRSGLLQLDGEALKIEGCGVERALGKKGSYRDEHRGTPVGGYLLSVAQKRVDRILKTNQRLTQDGWPVSYNPVAIIRYGKEFRYSPYGIWGVFAKLFGGNPDTLAEELAAPVIGIKGDTKASEFYTLKPQDRRAAGIIAFRLGLMAGAQNRALGAKQRNAITNTNAFSRYARNYVAFVEGEQVYLARVDDEDAFLYRNITDPLEGYRGVDVLISTALGALNEDEEEEEEEQDEEGEKVEGYAREVLGGKHHPYRSKSFRLQFERGYELGYAKPDDRRPITRADLRVAYGLAI